MLDGVRYLELPAVGRLDRIECILHRCVEQVHPDERQVGRRVLRLLNELVDVPLVVQLGHPEGARVGDFGKQDLSVRLVLLEIAHDVGNPLPDEVVTEIHEHRLAIGERHRQLEGVSQTIRALRSIVAAAAALKGVNVSIDVTD